MKLIYALPLALATLGISSAAVAQRPSDPDPGETERIAFAAGTDHATVSGSFDVGFEDRYVLWAGAGQTLTIAGRFGGLNIGVTAPDGSELPGGPDDSITYALPATGDYIISISVQRSEAATYSFTVAIPASATTPPGTAQRVEFAPGTDHAVLQGSLTDGVTDRYVLWAGAGGTMTFNPVAPLHLSVAAPDGTELPGGPGQTISYALPQNGDYVVEMLPGMGEQDTYAITVTIPAQPVSPVPAGQLPATR